MFRFSKFPISFFMTAAVVTLFIAGSVFGGDINRVEVGTYHDAKILPESSTTEAKAVDPEKRIALGYSKDSKEPGITVGTTTYDYQSNGRMNRQVDWRGAEDVHFTWTRQDNMIFGGDRGTAYEAWDATVGSFVFMGMGGGCDLHPRMGIGVNYSGNVGLDVRSDDKVIISNHHDEGLGFESKIWPDLVSMACFFPLDEAVNDPVGEQHLWPSHEHQETMGGDEIEHVFARNINLPNDIMYFRRVNGVWDDPPMLVDNNVENVSQTVTSSRVSDNVALVWLANLPAVPGGTPPVNSGRQRDNDVYYMISNDAGATWQPMVNVTDSDPTLPGWRAHTDLSCLFDTDDYLHIVWDAREYSPNPQPNGSFPHFFGSRLLHWSNDPGQGDMIRVIKDANWDLPPVNYCHGGAWNEMSIVKPMISECDGKLYALFVQFNDITNGISNDCHVSHAGINGDHSGTANGELYIAVSDNGGFNWDMARNLTNSYSPNCDPNVGFNCDSDMWPSMSRYGMEVIAGNFAGVPIIDPSGIYTGNYYLDVLYVDDIHPGGCVQDAMVWTTNAVKWFRVPCVEPVPNPILVVIPVRINYPAWPVPTPAKAITPVDVSVWTEPGIELDITLRMENVGNADLHVSTISTVETNGPIGWLAVGNTGPLVISAGANNYYDLDVSLNVGGIVNYETLLEGSIIIESDAPDKETATIPIYLNVSENEYSTQWADIRTTCTRINFNNAGNIGQGGNIPYGGYNMNFFDDCDVTENEHGYNDDARIYLRDASPYVTRIKAEFDTVLHTSIYYPDHGVVEKGGVEGLSDTGYIVLDYIVADSLTHTEYQYGATGRFLTRDSAIGYNVEYFAPTHPDTCGCIIVKEKIFNNSEIEIEDVYVGRISDWNIPSDISNDNGSNFDVTRDLFYCYGAEYEDDAIPNNDCVLADDRTGGIAYYNGYRLPYESEDDSLPHPWGLFTHLVPDWIDEYDGINAPAFFEKVENTPGYEIWTSPDPDSLYEDLFLVTTHGHFDFEVGDSLVIVSVMLIGYDGGVAEIQEMTDKAFQWIDNRPEVFTWPERLICDCEPGNCNGDAVINIFDITYLISYLYLGGPPPTPYELCSGDPNGDCICNIFDVTYLIRYLYQDGPPPVTCQEWVAECNLPLRK